MRPATVFALLLSVTAPFLTRAAHAAPTPPRWPDTRAGQLASRWVGAFAAGEDSMRRFFAANVAPARLAERPVAARLERYRELRDQLGTLQLDRVLASKPLELTARLLDADAKPHEFEFRATPSGPYLLESVKTTQSHMVPHGFGGFHH